MASILKVDELRGIASAGDITVTVGASVTQSLEQGLAKTWFNLDGKISTPAFRDSLNGSSVTDNGTGDYTANFTSSFANNYNTLTTDAGYTQGIGGPYMVSSYYWTAQTTNRRMRVALSSGTLTDCEQIGGALLGDLA